MAQREKDAYPRPMLTVTGVTRTLPSAGRSLTLLDDIHLHVPAGQFLAITGPSGSGKSTLLGLMAGLDRPDSGTIRWGEREITSLSEDELARVRGRTVGFVFQSFQLLPGLTALENVGIPLELQGIADYKSRASSLLEKMGLGDRARHLPAQLSGGEQQRVALARAFAPEPPLLLADEPTGNLDSANGEQVLSLLQEMRRRLGTTVVMVTHDASLASRADRVVTLKDGRIGSDLSRP